MKVKRKLSHTCKVFWERVEILKLHGYNIIEGYFFLNIKKELTHLSKLLFHAIQKESLQKLNIFETLTLKPN